MKKIISIVLLVIWVVSLAVPVSAVTPPLNVPDIPEIPKINVNIEIPDKIFDDWFDDHPIVIEPTKPSDLKYIGSMYTELKRPVIASKPNNFDYYNIIQNWLNKWTMNTVYN